jgi:tRNA pseudouridine32 synthase/23S rRNA pseudouridine746 synthase
MKDNNFILFNDSELDCTIPTQLISVFNEDIHELAQLASDKLQNYITECAILDDNFKLNHGNDTKKIGKMFGVLVVENQEGKIGYLQAFSGKLGNSNHHENFVPPIFDLLEESNFFNQGMSEITVLSNEINDFKNSNGFLSLKHEFESSKTSLNLKLQNLKEKKASLKKRRNRSRQIAMQELVGTELKKVLNDLAKQSIETKFVFKTIEAKLCSEFENTKSKYDIYVNRLAELKDYRKTKSSNLQQQLFDEYKFLNKKGERKLLRTIFNDPKGNKMPAGAGECSAPKLFQYAFLNNYKPIALAEFWWGKSPKSDNKVHQKFYPPCADKCVPILGFMLD